jgi:hypothetical protein
MTVDRDGEVQDGLEGKVRDTYRSVPSGVPPDDGLTTVAHRAQRIRAGPIASVAAASLVVVAAIVGPLVAFGAVGGRNATPGSASPGRGTLWVLQSLDLSGPRFIEGATGYLQVRSEDGRLIEEAQGPAGAGVRLRLELPSGTYRVVSYLRPCDGNCGYLDAPTGRCVATVGVAAGLVTRAVALVKPTEGCTFTVIGPKAGQDMPTEMPPKATLPDVVEVECREDGAKVLSPEVRPQADGVHIRVDNVTSQTRSVFVTYSTGGGVGGGAPPGVSELQDPQGGTALPAPPGPTLISCFDSRAHGRPDIKEVGLEIIDPEGLWTSTSLDCRAWVAGTPGFRADWKGEVGDPVDLARSHFEGLRPDDVIEQAGYPEATNVVVRVVRDAEIIATIEYWPDGQGGWLQQTVSRCQAADITG